MSVLSTKTVYTSKYFKVIQKTIERNGQKFTKDIIERNSSVIIIPYIKDEIYLESQYRDSFDRMNLEVVQGTITTGDDPLETAKRELQEEVGLTAKTWKKLAEWELSAILKAKQYIFAATDIEQTEQHLEFDEEIEVMKMPLEKVLHKIENGELTTASHIAALLLFDRLRREGKL
jgi:ADP-ribose pyrophosphatase